MAFDVVEKVDSMSVTPEYNLHFNAGAVSRFTEGASGTDLEDSSADIDAARKYYEGWTDRTDKIESVGLVVSSNGSETKALKMTFNDGSEPVIVKSYLLPKVFGIFSQEVDGRNCLNFGSDDESGIVDPKTVTRESFEEIMRKVSIDGVKLPETVEFSVEHERPFGTIDLDLDQNQIENTISTDELGTVKDFIDAYAGKVSRIEIGVKPNGRLVSMSVISEDGTAHEMPIKLFWRAFTGVRFDGGLDTPMAIWFTDAPKDDTGIRFGMDPDELKSELKKISIVGFKVKGDFTAGYKEITYETP